MRFYASLVCLFALFACGQSFAQEAARGEAAENGTVTIPIIVELEKLSGKGKIQEGTNYEISVNDLRVVEDGGRGSVLQQAIALDAPTGPHSLVLLVEGWGFGNNSRYDPLLEGIIYAADAVLAKLGDDDLASLVIFDMQPHVEVDFKPAPRARGAIRAKLGELYRQGKSGFTEASIFDAVGFTIDALEGQPGHKSIVLITKGTDTFSKLRYEDLRRKVAANSDVAVYAIGVVDILIGWGYETSPMNRSQMTTIAEESGGKAYFPRFPGAFPEIASDITNAMYAERLLTYRVHAVPVKDKKNPMIKIRVECAADVDKDGKPDKFKVYHKKTRLP